MLNIINNLRPFFEDCYRRISVREYARIIKISPPTASKNLEQLRKNGLLKKEEERQYIFYFANKESQLFIDLSRIYWRIKLEKSGLIAFFEQKFLNPIIILFGSLSKGESKEDSDIDIAIFAPSKNDVDLSKFENILKRKIQLFVFKERDEVENKELLNNLLNGYKIKGDW